jgi:hypothetical protein
VRTNRAQVTEVAHRDVNINMRPVIIGVGGGAVLAD